jgi:hypothetical protein
MWRVRTALVAGLSSISGTAFPGVDARADRAAGRTLGAKIALPDCGRDDFSRKMPDWELLGKSAHSSAGI